MVFASAERATDDIAALFEDGDWTTITYVGGLSTVGLALAATTGAIGASLLGLDLARMDRVDAIVVGLGALLYSWTVIQVLGPGVGGPLAVGGLVAVGLAAVAAVVGPRDPSSPIGRIRTTLDSVSVEDEATEAASTVAGSMTAGATADGPECVTCNQGPAISDTETGPAARDDEYR